MLLKFHESREHLLEHIRVCMATSAMPTAVEKQPQSSVLSMFSGTVLDVVKVSDLEKISDQDTAAGCGV